MENKIYFGEVIFFKPKRGYGFISWQKNGVQQKDLFVHYSDLLMEGFRTLSQGQKVQFEIGKNKNGIDKAINLIVIS